jgi:hypothetical protein
MICLATGPDLLADPIDETADSNPFAPDLDEVPAEKLPLWRGRTVATQDWAEPAEVPSFTSITRLFWRGIVAHWPIESRQEWGDLANMLQDSGLDWKTAERKAFEQIMERRSHRRR